MYLKPYFKNKHVKIKYFNFFFFRKYYSSYLRMTSAPNMIRLPQVNNAAANLKLNPLDDQQQIVVKQTKNNPFGLHQSILDGRLKQVSYFLKMGLKVNSKDKYGRTCLMLACLCDHEDYGLQATKLLLKFGADLNVCDSLGRNVLYMAVSQKRERLFDYLIDNHAPIIDFRSKDNDGNVLLNHVAVYGNIKQLKKIIEKMKDRFIELDQRNKSGYTALLLALKNDRYLNAYMLVKENQVSSSLRDNERHCNAIEWLMNRISVNKDIILDNRLTVENLKNSAYSNFEVMNSLCSSSESSETCTNMSSLDSSKFSTHKLKSSSKPLAKSKSAYDYNYKTWYQSSNQYFHSSLCEHTLNPNYSIEHSKSRFIPLILTPRNFNGHLALEKSFQIINSKKMEYTSSNENLDDLDESSSIKEIIEKLYETIYQKMSESLSMKTSNAADKPAQTEREQSSKQELKKTNMKLGRKISNAGNLSTKQRAEATPPNLTADFKPKSGSKELDLNDKGDKLENKTDVKYMYKLDNNIFDLESMRQTPKLLALQPISQISIKDGVHSMFDLYEASYGHQHHFLQKQDSFISKSSRESPTKSLTKSAAYNKEKSNVSQASVAPSTKSGYLNPNSTRVKFNMNEQ